MNETHRYPCGPTAMPIDKLYLLDKYTLAVRMKSISQKRVML